MENRKNITQEEIDLIKRAQSGSISAFNQIFYKYKYFVESILLSYIKDKDEARDITNIVFCKIYDKLPKFKEYNSFGGWLRILTKNTAIDYLRTVKVNFTSIDDEESDIQLETGESEEDLANLLTFDYVRDIISKMDSTKRQIFTMYYVDHHTISSISKRLLVPEGTIKSLLYRFRKQVFKHLKLN